MAARFSVFLLVSFLGTAGARDFPAELVVWNVGQGQWVTVIEPERCWHIDMGGEFAPWRKISAACREVKNVISLSHWDADHINFVSAARMRMPDSCLLNRPDGKGSAKKESAVLALAACPAPSPFAQWSNPLAGTVNGKSWVINWRGFLAPGDSPVAQEKIWIRHLGGLSTVRLLILGHHGSRTSTSPGLLNSLPNLQVTVASARQRRYGHPHWEVVRELGRRRIPLLRTEDWGNIHFRLP